MCIMSVCHKSSFSQRSHLDNRGLVVAIIEVLGKGNQAKFLIIFVSEIILREKNVIVDNGRFTKLTNEEKALEV